jgi:transcriptional regulator with XRE-family HTH domain
MNVSFRDGFIIVSIRDIVKHFLEFVSYQVILFILETLCDKLFAKGCVHMSFGQRLRELRRERNMTQQEFADAIMISRSTIAGYETAGKEPDNDRLLKIADFFGVSVDYMIGATNDRYVGTSRSAPEIVFKISKLVSENADAAQIVEALPGMSEVQINRVLGYVQALNELPDGKHGNIEILEENA